MWLRARLLFAKWWPGICTLWQWCALALLGYSDVCLLKCLTVAVHPALIDLSLRAEMGIPWNHTQEAHWHRQECSRSMSCHTGSSAAEALLANSNLLLPHTPSASLPRCPCPEAGRQARPPDSSCLARWTEEPLGTTRPGRAQNPRASEIN